MHEKLKQLMLKNIEAAHAIYSNYASCVRSLVLQKLRKIMDEKPVFSSFECHPWPPDIGWIGFTLTKKEYQLMWSIDPKRKTSYRVFDIKDKLLKEKLDGMERCGVEKGKGKENGQYIFQGQIEEIFREKIGEEDHIGELNNVEKLLKEEEREELVKEIVNKLIELINFCDSKLLPSEESS